MKTIKKFVKGSRKGNKRGESKTTKPFDIDAMNQNHYTSLHLAAKSGFVDIVEYLCENGADYTKILSIT